MAVTNGFVVEMSRSISVYGVFVKLLVVVLLGASCVITSPVVIGDETPLSSLQVIKQRNANIQKTLPFHPQSAADKGKVLRILFPERKDLLSYIISRNSEEKRQRQCYWSAISCY